MLIQVFVSGDASAAAQAQALVQTGPDWRKHQDPAAARSEERERVMVPLQENTEKMR